MVSNFCVTVHRDFAREQMIQQCDLQVGRDAGATTKNGVARRGRSSVLLSDERSRRSKPEWNWRDTLVAGRGTVILHRQWRRPDRVSAWRRRHGHYDERRFNPTTRRITNLKDIGRRKSRQVHRELVGGKIYAQGSRKYTRKHLQCPQVRKRWIH